MSEILTWPFRMIGFWLWYLKEFVVSNISVLKDIVSRGQDSTPGIARYECVSLTDGYYVLLTALVTVTPGTLVVGASETTDDGVRVMYIHGMYNEDADELRADIREMEERMLKGLMFHPKLNEGAK